MHFGNERLLIGEICLNVSVAYQSQQHRSRQGLMLHNARRLAVRQNGCILNCLATVTQSLTQMIHTSITFHALTCPEELGVCFLLGIMAKMCLHRPLVMSLNPTYLLQKLEYQPLAVKIYDIS
jgi:hypothetical protein